MKGARTSLLDKRNAEKEEQARNGRILGVKENIRKGRTLMDICMAGSKSCSRRCFFGLISIT